MNYGDLEAVVKAAPLADKVKLRAALGEMIALEAAELEAQRQAECPHLRAKTGELYAGIVTWYCPDCHLTRKESHFRERGRA